MGSTTQPGLSTGLLPRPSHQPLPPLSSPRPVETWTRSKTFQHNKGDYRKVGETQFTGACQDRTRGNGCQLTEGRDRVDIGKK